MFIYFDKARGCSSGSMRHGIGHGWGHGGWAHSGWGGRGRGKGGHRPGGRGRMFDSGELRLVLLKLIADEPRHGYDLIREIESLTGGAYAPSPGVVYPTLTLLADMDFIKDTPGEGTRKQFAVTDAGRTELDANKDLVEALIARLTGVGKEQEKTNSHSVRRAMGNLREVLVNRLSGDDVDEALLHQFVELIDETAQKIERL